jgi:3-isopropylmalate/(R)-2-methylmalate dehydratase small subunit
MHPFTSLKAQAAPLRMVNVDTDIIIPKQFLRTIKRTGLGVHAFNDIRYDDNGDERDDFVLNQDPYRHAQILITGENFGCGSSREHAPWALLDFGIRCIIAPSFADIFHNNCFKNGILPVTLAEDQVEALMQKVEHTPDMPVHVDLEAQRVTCDDLHYDFDIDGFRKYCLYHGLDDIGLTLEKSDAIAAFEEGDKHKRPWLYKE